MNDRYGFVVFLLRGKMYLESLSVYRIWIKTISPDSFSHPQMMIQKIGFPPCERILRFRRIGVQKRMVARPAIIKTTILHTSNRGGRREQLYNHSSPTHTIIFVLKSHPLKFSTAFFEVSKTCRTRVEPRSIGLVLHSLENLRRKRVQLTRFEGDFTVNAHSLSDKLGEGIKSQVSCFKGFVLTENSPDNKGLLVRECLEWWST